MLDVDKSESFSVDSVGFKRFTHFDGVLACPMSVVASYPDSSTNECSEAEVMSGPTCLDFDFQDYFQWW